VRKVEEVERGGGRCREEKDINQQQTNGLLTLKVIEIQKNMLRTADARTLCHVGLTCQVTCRERLEVLKSMIVFYVEGVPLHFLHSFNTSKYAAVLGMMT
jgi:hypothetical protein